MDFDKIIIKEIKKAVNNNNRSLLEAVFEQIYYKYSQLVKYVIYKLVGDSDLTDDLTQEVFTSFFNTIRSSEIKNIKYLLVTIAKNKSIDYLRKNKIDVIVDDNLVLNFGYEQENNISEMINDLRLYLSEDEIEIIVLHLVYDFTFKKIASIQNVTTSVINNKYNRAIKKYKNKVDK